MYCRSLCNPLSDFNSSPHRDVFEFICVQIISIFRSCRRPAQIYIHIVLGGSSSRHISTTKVAGAKLPRKIEPQYIQYREIWLKFTRYVLSDPTCEGILGSDTNIASKTKWSEIDLDDRLKSCANGNRFFSFPAEHYASQTTHATLCPALKWFRKLKC